MKIMFCILCLSYGGADKNMCIVANELSKRGHDVSICNLNYLPTVQKTDDSIVIYDVPQYKTKGIKRFQQLLYITKLCKSERPDVLISFLHVPNYLIPWVGKITGIPSVICERGDPNKRKGIMQKCYNLADYAVFQTDGAKEYFNKRLQENSIIIPNPVVVDTNNVDVNYERKFIISFSARFAVEQKRQDLMLDAFKLVHTKHPKYSLHFYGDGPDEEMMKEYTRKLGLADYVIFHGRSDSILSDISNSDVFVLSSDYEGIPNALIEAMSIGLPCVSTDCSPGGARMLIDNNENGIIVSRGDKIALADAICKMIEDRKFAQKCGEAAKNIKEKFQLQKIIDSWEVFLKEVVNNEK